jgi:uncharacterized membrane protein
VKTREGCENVKKKQQLFFLLGMLMISLMSISSALAYVIPNAKEPFLIASCIFAVGGIIMSLLSLLYHSKDKKVTDKG